MNELITNCQDLATELFILKERLGCESDGVFFNIEHVKRCRGGVVFDDFNAGAYTHRAAVDIYDTEQGSCQVEDFAQGFGDSYNEALSSLYDNLKNNLDKIKSLDGQVREIDGKKYKLTLVGG